MIRVDHLMGCVRSRRWPHDEACHLFVELPETNLEALHKFARAIGLKRAWFQSKPGSMPHYDLTPGKRAAAVRSGAVETDRNKTVEILRAWRKITSPDPLGDLFTRLGANVIDCTPP